MRKIIAVEMPLGSVPIEKIDLCAKSRDDIPVVLRGLQAIYADQALRAQLFELLDAHIRPGTDRSVGRPGMEMWRILVFAAMKQGLGCDFDRLAELANKHCDIRAMLGHGPDWMDGMKYDPRLVMDNVALLPPELLREVNRLVVATGQDLSKKKLGEALVGRCDSFVVETDVHHPTDINLLWDATRSLIREAHAACAAHGIAGWRQRKHLTGRVRRLFYAVRTSHLWKSRPEAVAGYIGFCGKIVGKAEASLAALECAGASAAEMDSIRRFLQHARRQIDQIDRRILKGEVIPHAEKVFSVFEEHTRWISKGKAGRPVELGVPVCIVEDQFQFVLDHKILWEGGDTDAAVPMIEACLAAHPDLRDCSFDRGFHSPANRERLDGMLDTAALPKKGHLSAADRQRESAPAFAAARRKHPAVESAINNLEHRGLNRVRTHGADGFERTVGLSILAANLHRVGVILRNQERKRIAGRRRHRLRLAA